MKYDAALVRNGSTYDHYAYGTNHIFIEQGLLLSNGPNGATPAGAPLMTDSDGFGQRGGYFIGHGAAVERQQLYASDTGRDIMPSSEFLV